MAAQICSARSFPNHRHEAVYSAQRAHSPLLSTPFLHRRRNKQLNCSTVLRKLSKLDVVKEKLASPHKNWRSVSASASEAINHCLLDPAYRAKLAEEYGFVQIGEPLPPNVTVRDLMETIPPEAFKYSTWKAWKSLAISLAAYAAGLYCTAKAPWYLVPFAWFWTGTNVAGLFVIGHDCAHKTFCSNKLVEDIVGNLVFLPLIYPYEAWRFKHDQHHAKTNMLNEDTAWQPITMEEYYGSPRYMQLGYQLLLGPLRCWATIYHWIDRHFYPLKFRPNERMRVKGSLGVVFGFMTIGWPLIIYLTGIRGWMNFWLMPWLVFHFWMSTVTMIHHSAPHIRFNDVKTWNNAQAQLCGAVNCEYPKWIELLAHDINVHVPHHISPRIPSYNLRLANDALRKQWGKHFNEARWNWRLMKTIFTMCHLYDGQNKYVPFDEIKEGALIFAALRKVMPNIP